MYKLIPSNLILYNERRIYACVKLRAWALTWICVCKYFPLNLLQMGITRVSCTLRGGWEFSMYGRVYGPPVNWSGYTGMNTTSISVYHKLRLGIHSRRISSSFFSEYEHNITNLGHTSTENVLEYNLTTRVPVVLVPSAVSNDIFD